MDQTYWAKSLTKRWFLRDQEALPEDAVQQVTKQVKALSHGAATWIRQLHDHHWHTGCSYPQLSETPCAACKTILDIEQFLLQEVYAHIGEVVIDFFHEPDGKDQLEEAVKLYAWASFHQGKHQELVRWRNELLDYSKQQVLHLSSESCAHKEIQPDETTQENLKPLILAFAKAYSERVHEFDAWCRDHPGVTASAFPAV